MLVAAAEPVFSDSQALSALLTTEGFMLAAVALAVNLDAPDQPRARSATGLFFTLSIVAAIVLSIAAIGAGFAWSGIFLGGSYGGLSRAAIAISLAVAIVAQPIIALMLAIGSRTR